MWVQYGRSAFEIEVGDEDGFNRGDLKGYGLDEHADFFGKLDCVVNYTSGAIVAGMTEAQVLTYLRTLTLDLRIDTDRLAKPGKAQDPANVLHPLQEVNFADLRLMALRTVEKEVLLISDTSTGLRKSFAAETSTINFTMFFSMGMLATVQEYQKLYGVGPDLLELLRLRVRVVSDGLNAFDSDLTTDSFEVTVKGFRRKVEGRRASLLPMLRNFQPGADERQLTTFSGILPVDLIDVNQKLSTTNFEEVTVEVGDSLVTEKETPAEIRAGYVASNTVSTPENTISSYATELYVTDEMPLAQQRTGTVVVTQEVHNEDFDANLTALPAPNEATVHQFVKALAAQGLKDGQEFHFTSSLGASKVPADKEGKVLPVAGLTYYFSTDPRAQDCAGLRVTKEGRIRLYFPPAVLKEASTMYREGMQEVTTATPGGNTAKMDAAVNLAGRDLPGFVDDEVHGYPSSTRPGGGSATRTYRTTRATVRAQLGLKD